MNPSTTTTRYVLTIVVPLTLALLVICAVALSTTRAPAIARAADVVESIFLPGDIVVLYPENRFPDLELFAADVDAIASTALPLELERFDRVILVRPRSDEPPSMRRMLVARSTMLYAEDVDDLTVELFQLDAPERVVVDLVDTIRTARVGIEPRGEDPVACPWEADRFDCPDADWTWVGVTSQVFDGEPYRCVWSHPVDGADLTIEFPVVSGTHVTGWYGLTDYAVSIPDGSPVRMTIDAGDSRGRFRAHRQLGRRPLRFDLPEEYAGPLTITISAARAGVRHFCWDLQVVDVGAP